MAKKRGGIVDGIKAVYHVHQALDAMEGVTASKVRQSFGSIAELLMIGASLAAVCGLFWLANFAIHFFKN